jgi:hypothetical protein
MPETNQKKSWTVMVYLAGENNLAEECIYALKEMKRAEPRPGTLDVTESDLRVKLVAQLDASGLGGKESRYLLRGGDDDGSLKKSVIAIRDTSETTYRSVLRDFISTSILIDGLADKYLLVLSGHGSGIADDFLSRDVETPDTLSIPKLQWVLREVKNDISEQRGKGESEDFKIDIIGLDSCMMSMAEIGYELRNYAHYMVGAEGYEPNTGWPYERVVVDILSDPDVEPDALAKKIVEKYIAYYSDFLSAGRSVDLSVSDLSVMQQQSFVDAIRKLSDVLTNKLSDPEAMRHILLAHWEAQSYKDDQYIDLYDFCDLLDMSNDGSSTAAQTGSVVLRDASVDEHIVEACRAVKMVLNDGPAPLILKSCYSGPAVQHSHGLSVYFPWSNVMESYSDLEFAHDTNWGDFLQHYVEKTRRLKRPCPDPEAQTLTGKLFFNQKVSGFEFLLTENKDAPKLSRILSNKVGSMKNPALEYAVCPCTNSPDSAGRVGKIETVSGYRTGSGKGKKSSTGKGKRPSTVKR